MMLMMGDVNGLLDAISSYTRDFNLLHICGYLLLFYYWRLKRLSEPHRLVATTPKSETVTAYDDDQQHECESHGPEELTPPMSECMETDQCKDHNVLNIYRGEEERLDALVPSSTLSERRRFLFGEKGRVESAHQSLEEYIRWTTTHRDLQQQLCLHVLNPDPDWHDWNLACATAIVASAECSTRPLPRIARTFTVGHQEASCRRGYRIFHIRPGKMDDNLVSLETYALAIALYLDRKLQRDSFERVTVMIDTRGGEGWRNLNAAQLIPFIQHTSKLLLSMFPERLGLSIVYPVPFALAWIWNVVRRCLDPVTAEKICLLTGPARIHSCPPYDQLVQYIDKELANLIEAERLSSFQTQKGS